MTRALPKDMQRLHARLQREAKRLERISRAERGLHMGIDPKIITKLFELSASDLSRLQSRVQTY